MEEFNRANEKVIKENTDHKPVYQTILEKLKEVNTD